MLFIQTSPSGQSGSWRHAKKDDEDDCRKMNDDEDDSGNANDDELESNAIRVEEADELNGKENEKEEEENPNEENGKEKLKEDEVEGQKGGQPATRELEKPKEELPND